MQCDLGTVMDCIKGQTERLLIWGDRLVTPSKNEYNPNCVIRWECSACATLSMHKLHTL